MAAPPAAQPDVRLEVVDDPSAFYGAADDGVNSAQTVIANAFGHQIRDAVWRGLNPGWETPEGAKASAVRNVQRWKSISTDKDGRPNTIFLVATVPGDDRESTGEGEGGGDSYKTGRRIVGFAIWAQISMVPGYGDPVYADIRNVDGKGFDLAKALFPNNEREQRYMGQAFASLLKRRASLVREKAAAFERGELRQGEKPASFHLDLCVVDPAWQRRGIAQKLVGWGLEEAKRRGGLECTTEASSMGRGAYMKLGFNPEGDVPKDIEFEVDEEFKNEGRDPLPPNLFLRTGLLS